MIICKYSNCSTANTKPISVLKAFSTEREYAMRKNIVNLLAIETYFTAIFHCVPLASFFHIFYMWRHIDCLRLAHIQSRGTFGTESVTMRRVDVKWPVCNSVYRAAGQRASFAGREAPVRHRGYFESELHVHAFQTETWSHVSAQQYGGESFILSCH